MTDMEMKSRAEKSESELAELIRQVGIVAKEAGNPNGIVGALAGVRGLNMTIDALRKDLADEREQKNDFFLSKQIADIRRENAALREKLKSLRGALETVAPQFEKYMMVLPSKGDIQVLQKCEAALSQAEPGDCPPNVEPEKGCVCPSPELHRLLAHPNPIDPTKCAKPSEPEKKACACNGGDGAIGHDPDCPLVPSKQRPTGPDYYDPPATKDSKED